MELRLNENNGTYTINVDGQIWLTGGQNRIPLTLHKPEAYTTLLEQVQASTESRSGSDLWGHYREVSLSWGEPSRQSPILVTSFREYSNYEIIMFRQSWPQGLLQNGSLLSNGKLRSAVLSPFPSFTTEDGNMNLNFLQFGGCQLANTYTGKWSNSKNVPGGERLGIPLVLYNKSGHAIVIAPSTNWFTSVHEPNAYGIGVGIKQSVAMLPQNFSHDTLIVFGDTPNKTLSLLGNLLLQRSGKIHINPYSDFVLSHLGYWTDNGAFYDSTQKKLSFDNYEDVILALKDEWRKHELPFRYVQWDDWQWEHQDIPGPTPNWLPNKTSLPSGMTDWLQMPVSLYNPMYSSQTSYIQNSELGEWVVDYNSSKGGSALPLSPMYYRAAFRNGSRAQMKMFEQDFLCTYLWETSLLTSNISIGMEWLKAMNRAAESFQSWNGSVASTTLQLCMMTPSFVLASSELSRVTNGRGTSDNDHQSQADLHPFGHSGLLMGAFGIWASRDNVFTTAYEPFCPKGNCTSPDYRLQNVAAVLGGGPYGPSDGLGFFNIRLIMRSCRKDGVLLKADRPLATTTESMLVNFENDPSGFQGYVWSTHSQIGSMRWTMILSIDTTQEIQLSTHGLDMPLNTMYVLWDFWSSDGEGPPRTAKIVSNNTFTIPQSPPPSPILPRSSSGFYHILSPVLSSGWCILGEGKKIVPVSSHRFVSIIDSKHAKQGSALTIVLRLASQENVSVWILPPQSDFLHGFQSGVQEIKPLIISCNGALCKGRDCSTNVKILCANRSCICT